MYDRKVWLFYVLSFCMCHRLTDYWYFCGNVVATDGVFRGANKTLMTVTTFVVLGHDGACHTTANVSSFSSNLRVCQMLEIPHDGVDSSHYVFYSCACTPEQRHEHSRNRRLILERGRFWKNGQHTC